MDTLANQMYKRLLIGFAIIPANCAKASLYNCAGIRADLQQGAIWPRDFNKAFAGWSGMPATPFKQTSDFKAMALRKIL